MSHAVGPDAMRDRLVRFYSHYHTPGLRLVDQLLCVYAGREEALMMVLEDKYGPEPSPPSQTRACPPTTIHDRQEEVCAPAQNALMTQLTLSLKQKTMETVQLRAQIDNMRSKLSGVEQLRRENEALRREVQRLTLEGHATAEEKQQMVLDLAAGDRHVGALQQRIYRLESQSEALLADLSALRLSAEQPETQAEFTALIQECRTRLRTHFDSRIQRMEEEMTRYYDYTAKQLHDRDAIITLLRRGGSALD